MNLPAIIDQSALVTLLLVRGVSESATVNNIIVVIKLSVVHRLYRHRRALRAPGTVVAAGARADPSAGRRARTWTSGTQIGRALVAVVTGDNTTDYGVGGVIHGAAVIFFAYIGFEAVSTAGAESRNPGRDMPIGILGALVICTILYIATCAVLVGIVPYDLTGRSGAARRGGRLTSALRWFARSW